MISTIYYPPKRLQFVIDDERTIIETIRSVRKGEVSPIATNVDGLRMTTERTHIEGKILYIDSYGLAEIILWVIGQRQPRSGRDLFMKVMRMFPGDPLINDLLRASLRATTGLRDVAGEASYHLHCALDAHPEEWAELQALWKSRPLCI